MSSWFPDLERYSTETARADLVAAVVVTFLAVPQGLAYAMVAGLPPAAGLYAAALPAIVASLARSSNHVIAGPTNAVSLLVGGAAFVAASPDPLQAAALLALLVGVFQVLAGVLRLGALVDYLSSSVVLGYLTGAGVLIIVGQLPSATRTARGGGTLLSQLWTWVLGLGDAHVGSVALTVGTVLAVLAVRRWSKRAPWGLVALAAGVGLSFAFDLGEHGFRLSRFVAPVPRGWPAFSAPPLEPSQLRAAVPAAVAVMVLSLVEVSAVGRRIAASSRQHLEGSREFVGQGLANVTAAFVGAYPVSGSLGRTELSYASGARTRMAGVFGGVLVLGVLLVGGPLFDATPIASLAGLLLVIGADLVDVRAIRRVLRSGPGDALAFLGTLVGTFVFPLDEAIYLGVAISIAMFLRRARHLVVQPIRVVDGRLQEDEAGEGAMCPSIRVLHVEGDLFFGAAGELRSALVDEIADPAVKVLVVRLKRTRNLDYSTATVFEELHDRLEEEGRHLLLVGLRDRAMRVLDRSGVAEAIGTDRLYPTQPGWFRAMDDALREAQRLADDDHMPCPLAQYLARRAGVIGA